MHKKPITLFRMLICMLIIIVLPTEICVKGITNSWYGMKRLIDNDIENTVQTNKETENNLDDEGLYEDPIKDVNESEDTLDEEDLAENQNKDINESEDNIDEPIDNGDPNTEDPDNAGDDNDAGDIVLPVDRPSEENDDKKDEGNEPQTPLDETEEDVVDSEESEVVKEEDEIHPLLNESSIIVNSFNELKDALSNDNGIDTVYLSVDIEMEKGGITVDRNKTNLTISGINPEDPNSIIHSLTDVNSTLKTDSIFIPDRANMSSITIEDLIVKGRNYYGFVSIYDTLIDVVITYDNVDYTGPQMTYNRRGKAVYRDCNIVVDNPYGGAAPQELAEITYVEFEGKVTIEQYSSSNKVFWMEFAAGSITVAPYADIDIYVDSYLFCYNPNISLPITIGEYATFNFSGPTGMGYNNFGTFTVEKGAECYIITREKYDRSMLRLNGDLVVNEGAVFEALVNYQAIASVVIMKGYSYIFNNPKRVVLYNVGNRAFGWSGQSGKLYIETQQLNYWETPGPGTILDSPKYFWRKRKNEALIVSGIGAPDAALMSSISHNMDESDDAALLTPATFNVLKGRVISAGVLNLTADYMQGNNPYISGVTESDAEIKVSYQLNGETVELFGRADESGHYRVDIENKPEVGSDIHVLSNYRYLFTNITFEAEGELSFVSVPSNLSFKTSALSNQIEKIGRKESDWQIVISDTRLNPTNWRLSARLKQPFHAINGEVPDMKNAIVFVNNDGKSYPIQNDEDTIIYEYDVNAPRGKVSINWDEDRGVLAEIQPGAAYSDVEYVSSIVWNLTDAP